MSSHPVEATLARCTCARCGRIWVVKIPGFLDMRGVRCPRCQNGTFTLEPLKLIAARSAENP